MSKKKLNSRWGRAAMRYSGDVKLRPMEDARWVRNARGVFRLLVDRVSELVYVSRRRETFGWFHGARVRKA